MFENEQSSEIRTMTLDFLYHATFPDCEATIRQAGIVPGIDDVVHLSNKSDYAAGFVRISNGIKIVGEADILKLVTNESATGEVVKAEEIVICTVVAGLLDSERLTVRAEEEEPSGFYPLDLVSFVYTGTIDPAWILQFQRIPLKPFFGDSFL